jgi:hypothetical protein
MTMNRDVLSKPTTEPDRGLVQRGLVLLALMATLAGVVIMIVVQRPSAPAKSAAVEPLVVPLVSVGTGFPAALPWRDVVALGGQLPSATGWEIRYNAALALARRGSQHTPWTTIREMLDQERQLHNFPAKLAGATILPDEEAALRTLHATLTAIADWHKKQAAAKAAAKAAVPSELQLVYADVDRLAQSDNTPIRVQADRTRQLFFRK